MSDLFKIIVIISLIQLIYSSSYEINTDGEDCSFSPEHPSSPEECTKYHTENISCCFAQIEFPNRKKENACIPIDREARFALNYLTIFSYKDYKDVTATFDCGQKDRLCGMELPKKVFQCSEHSSTSKSCCFLSTPTYTECVLTQTKYKEEKTFNLFDDSKVICKCSNIYNKEKNFGILFFLLFEICLDIMF